MRSKTSVALTVESLDAFESSDRFRSAEGRELALAREQLEARTRLLQRDADPREDHDAHLGGTAGSAEIFSAGLKAMLGSTKSQPIALERLDPLPESPWYGEHRSRYQYAGPYVTGKAVLDVGSGVGYGLSVLSSWSPTLLVGLDKQPPGASWRGAGSAFLASNASQLPFKAATFEVVTCFEVIEHLDDDATAVSEIRRVLRQGGVALFSTPRKLDAEPVPRNPFHRREYSPDLLLKLLSTDFPEVKILGQRPSDSYGASPFWMTKEVLRRVGRLNRTVMRWHMIRRFPLRFREPLSRVFLHRSMYPGEHDFVFEPEPLRDSHGLLAICRS